MNEAISVHDPRLLVESLIVLGRSHDGAVENDLRHAVANIVAKIESDAKVIADLRRRLEGTAYPLGEIDGLMKVIAALAERVDQHDRWLAKAADALNISPRMSDMDLGSEITEYRRKFLATNEQTAGKSK